MRFKARDKKGSPLLRGLLADQHERARQISGGQAVGLDGGAADEMGLRTSRIVRTYTDKATHFNALFFDSSSKSQLFFPARVFFTVVNRKQPSIYFL